MSYTREELLQLATMTSKWSDPYFDSKFFHYQPNPIMTYFHNSHASTRAIFGGNRSGKTYAKMIDVTARFLGKAPKSLEETFPKRRLDKTHRIRVCSIDYPNNFMKVIWKYIELLVPASEITSTIKEQGRIKAICNGHGGFIEFMQYEQDVKKFQGSSLHLVTYDEEPPQSIRDENLLRLADTNGEEIFSLTPVSAIDRPLIWIYDAIFEKASRVVEKFDDVISDVAIPDKDKNVHVFFSNTYDNRSLDRAAVDRIMDMFPEDERAVREKGHFMLQSGRIYKEYSDAIHLVDEFDWTKKDGTVYVAIDPHPRTPHAVLFMYVNAYNTMYIVDELFIDCGAKELVEAIKIKLNGRVPELIIIDPFAYTPDPSTKNCFAYDLIDCGLNNPMPIAAPKDKANGIIMTKKALKVENSMPSLYVTRNCKRFRFEISHYVWDAWKKDTGNLRNPKQTPVDKDDHMMENLYRLILKRPQYIDIEEPTYKGEQNALRYY